MAGIKLSGRINASSLFETIVALMIIVLVFGIAMTIYVNVLRNSSSLAELKASQRLEKIAYETVTEKKYFDETITEEGIVFEKHIAPYNNIQGLLLLELQAYDESKRILASYKSIIEEHTNGEN
jgi:hypothetical protein